MGFWNSLVRLGNFCENVTIIAEEISGAGADASKGLRRLAGQWNQQNQHKLDQRQEAVDKVIASGSTDFSNLLKTEDIPNQ